MNIRRVGGMLALLGVAIAAEAGQATTPGTNGKIAFRRYFDDAQTWGAVFVANADGTGARQITHPARGVIDDQPDWSPNGSLIVFTRCSEVHPAPCAIYTVKSDGTGLKRLSPPPAKAIRDDANASFAPDGRHISFTLSTGNVKSYAGGDQIQHSAAALMDLNGKHLRVLARAGEYRADYVFPMLSPDGTRFLYQHPTCDSSRTSPTGRGWAHPRSRPTGPGSSLPPPRVSDAPTSSS